MLQSLAVFAKQGDADIAHGAEVIYDHVVEPYLIRNEERLDKSLQLARSVAHRSTEKVSMSAYDRWMGYMQGVVSQHETHAQNTEPESSGYSGLGGLLKTVSQNMPQPASAANYLAGISGITNKPQTTRSEPAAKPTVTSMLTSWAASFSMGSSTGLSDEQRLHDIQSRKLQLQKLVSQLEGSERAISDRNAVSKTPVAESSGSTPTHADASEFEDDAVMVGEPTTDTASGSRTQNKPKDANEPVDKNPIAANTPSRRWFW
ncbi:hypothetical protein IW141_004160 [Coemansia sp. RSA 355]|nr:hypothetical protein IW144_002924 [Coemansia sp. RSA 522]KAJ2288848.1 hypothetical protein IW141_004160 [Coemansia sp. RSA 355]